MRTGGRGTQRPEFTIKEFSTLFDELCRTLNQVGTGSEVDGERFGLQDCVRYTRRDVGQEQGSEFGS